MASLAILNAMSSPTAALRVVWGERVKRARKARDWSVLRLAQEAKIDPSQVSKIERGRMGVGDEPKIRLAIALDCRVEDLFPFPDLRTNRGRSEFAAQVGWTLTELIESFDLTTPASVMGRSERRTA